MSKPYNAEWGKQVEVSVWGRNTHPITGESQTYHRKPRPYVQGRGGGLPYNTNNWAHYTNRYGMSPTGRKPMRQREPELFVGVRAETVQAMMEAGHQVWARAYLKEMHFRLFVRCFGPGGSWEMVDAQRDMFHLLRGAGSISSASTSGIKG